MCWVVVVLVECPSGHFEADERGSTESYPEDLVEQGVPHVPVLAQALTLSQHLAQLLHTTLNGEPRTSTASTAALGAGEAATVVNSTFLHKLSLDAYRLTMHHDVHLSSPNLTACPLKELRLQTHLHVTPHAGAVDTTDAGRA